jgi:serine/threonine-protein kinase
MNEPKGGRVIAGKFRLEWPIGRGGMGTVWAAMHLQLDMPVAVKFMDPSAADADGRLRFEREARAIAQLRSPHVVQVLDHGVDNGTPYIVMELLEGEDLEGRLRRVKKLTIPVAARIFTQSSKALRRAHDAGIIHRDLKPNNVFLARVDDEEVVKLLDFGVAKIWTGALDPHNESTQQGLLLGSPCYMSPEQARGHKNIDHRSDLWSLAVILFRSLTGVRPFDANTIADLIIKICAEDPPLASELMPDAPPGIDEFFFRCFARDPDQRYPSALEMAADFESIVRSSAPAGETFGSGRIVPQRSTTSSGMQSVPPQRSRTNPSMPGVVITPQRALTNPSMQAVPAHIAPPPYEPRASQKAASGYEPAKSQSGSYPAVQTSPAASSYMPAARPSYPGPASPPPAPVRAYGTGPYAAPAPPPAPPSPYSPPHDPFPGASDPQDEVTEAYGGGSYGADSGGGGGDAHYGAETGAPDYEASHEQPPERAHDEAFHEGTPAPPPMSGLPDSAPHGEGLGTTSQTLRESSPSGRQLVVWTTIAAAATAIMVVLIVMVARARYTPGPAARPQGTGEVGVVTPPQATTSPQTAPLQPHVAPTSTDAAPSSEPSSPANPTGGFFNPGAPSASASASAPASPVEPPVPFNMDGDDAGAAPPPPHPPQNNPRPGGAPTVKKPPKLNLGY